MQFLKRQQQLQHLTVGRYRLTHTCIGDTARVGVGGRVSVKAVGQGQCGGVRRVLRGEGGCGGRVSVKGVGRGQSGGVRRV